MINTAITFFDRHLFVPNNLIDTCNTNMTVITIIIIAIIIITNMIIIIIYNAIVNHFSQFIWSEVETDKDSYRKLVYIAVNPLQGYS